jgi:DNA topoisomerase-1
MKNLVIVESPTKSKTIEKYLGPDFTVLATVGHFRDLAKDGIDTDNDFALTYEVQQGKEKVLREIVKASKKCEKLLLATDPDREGEAIAWHVYEYLLEKKALKPSQAVQRVVFHEITENAVRSAFNEPRQIDRNLVDAYQARRALDMLFGFGLSDVLRRKLPGTKSGGRVQSPSLRLVCEREEEIENFDSREYWSVEATLQTPANQITKARLIYLDSKKLGKFSLADEATAKRAAAEISRTAFQVSEVKEKQVQTRPYAPFRTSTLQQAASRTLNMTAKQCAGVAQELFREGLITYMRTDSVNLSSIAVQSIREAIKQSPNLGPRYLPSKPHPYSNKAKNAQEAHEAIRPTNVNCTPKDLPKNLAKSAFQLYELIWKRTMASQMQNGLDDQVAIDFSSPDKMIVLHTSGSRIAFDGFRKIYAEEKGDDISIQNQGDTIPKVEKGENAQPVAVFPEQHFTKPPGRYNEASLIQKLEELGIGRPSTYPSIISVLQDRNYVNIENRQLIPQAKGRGVTIMLESRFRIYVDYDFTADLEDKLDQIAAGTLVYPDVLKEFYAPFDTMCSSTMSLSNTDVLNFMNDVAGARFFPLDKSGKIQKCPKCNGEVSFKWSAKRGPFIGCVNFDTDNGCQFSLNFSKSERDGLDGPRTLGLNNEGEVISLRGGPYGPYVQAGEKKKGKKPKTMGLPASVEPENCDLALAIKLLSLPRTVGKHPETDKEITVTIGPYGPYINHGKKENRRSLDAEDDVFTIGINRTVSLLAEPRKQRQGANPTRILGQHSEDGLEVALYDGRFGGHYVKHKNTNASLPKSSSPETVTLEEAERLIAERNAKPKRSRKKKGVAAKKKPNRKKK